MPTEVSFVSRQAQSVLTPSKVEELFYYQVKLGTINIRLFDNFEWGFAHDALYAKTEA